MTDLAIAWYYDARNCWRTWDGAVLTVFALCLVVWFAPMLFGAIDAVAVRVIRCWRLLLTYRRRRHR